MSTSGNTIFILKRDDILTDALRAITVLGEGESPNSAQVTEGYRRLNNIVSEFRTLGMQSYLREDLIIPLVTGQQAYVIGVGQAINTPYPTYIYDVNVQLPPYQTEIRLLPAAIYDFNSYPVNATGTPTSFNYKADINVGTLTLWPTPDASVPAGTQLKVTYQRPIEVFDGTPLVTGNADMDFPQEWGNALTFALALVWADSYGVPEAKKAWLEKQADRHLATALSTANEQGSMFLQKEWSGDR